MYRSSRVRGDLTCPAVGLACLLAAALSAAEPKEWVVPLETATVHGQWQGRGICRRSVDAVNGALALEYTEALAGTSTEVWLEIDRLDLRDYDVLRFDWRATGDPILVQVAVEGYPPGLRRNYYLCKNPVRPGHWQRVWLDLALDDDGAHLPEVKPPDGKLVLRFTLRLNELADISPEPHVGLRLAEMKFVRLPVRLDGDLRHVREVRDDGRIGQAYTLTVTNRDSEPRQAVLYLDQAGLTAFAVTLSAESFALAPGETRQVQALITADAKRAERLEPLHYEEAAVFAGVAGLPDSIAPWNWGYMQHRLRGTVPLPERAPPLLLPEAEAQAGRARLAGTAPAVAAATLLKQADSYLDIDPEPPDTLHGNPNHYFDPVQNSPLRCHGPGKHWCEKSRQYVDVSTFPEPVQRAAAFAHHTYLTSAALTLARAGWESGDRKYLRKAADILMAYARKYPRYPRSDPSATGFQSHVGWAILQESWWYDPVPRAYDLIRAAGIWTPEEERRVRDDLVVEGFMTLRAHRSVANQQAEYNRGVGLGSLTARHHVLAAESLNGEYGMRAQWALDFDADGWTMERDLGYHRAAVGPFLDFARALAANGVPVFDADFKKLFDAPVQRSLNLVAGPGDFYLEAWTRYRDPLYQRSLAAARQEALPVLPEGFPNSVLPAAGQTVLRRGRSDADLCAASINWAAPSHRGGRVLLNPLLHWHGQALNAWVERIAYGYKQAAFSYGAAAGNSVVVDGQAHAMVRADQVALRAGDLPAGRWKTPLRRPQYAGVEWTRSLALCGDSAVLLDQFSTTRPVRLDWFTFLADELLAASAPGGQTVGWTPCPEFLEQGDGYSYFLEPRQADSSPPTSFRYRLGKTTTTLGQLNLLAPAGTRVLQMGGLVGWHPREVPVVVMRQPATTAGWFAAAYTGLADGGAGAAVELTAVEVSQDGRRLPPEQALAVRLRQASGSFLVLTSEHDGAHQVDGRTLPGPLAVVRLE